MRVVWDQLGLRVSEASFFLNDVLILKVSDAYLNSEQSKDVLKLLHLIDHYLNIVHSIIDELRAEKLLGRVEVFHLLNEESSDIIKVLHLLSQHLFLLFLV
jgi:hypothetical protein